MNPNPFSGLLHSRKFWLVVLDAVIAIVGLWVGALAEPETQRLIMTTIGILQPVFITIIYSIAKEDAAKTYANGWKAEEACCNRETKSPKDST